MTKERKYFGTDGVRGCVGHPPITADFVLKLGWAAGRVFSSAQGENKILIGKDTRLSGYMFESALVSGLAAAGVNSYLLGPMPTPGVAYLTRTLRAKAGIVISASHNPYHDNGIKFFSPSGTKLPDEVELSIEQLLDEPLSITDSTALGKAMRILDAQGRYIEFCKSTVATNFSLKGLKIVLDCANGATYKVAPCVFKELGAEVIEIAVSPNGLNINDSCGATQPESLQKVVLAEHADLGIAFDGDGDRVIMVDHLGEIVDGDELLFIIACHLHQQQRLKGGVVGTVMSNFGLELALNELSIPFARSSVGDRYVLDTLLTKGWTLGGEGSGHIISLDLITTGDGIISALQVLIAMQEKECSLHTLKSGMRKFPQKLINVEMKKTCDLNQHAEIKKAVKNAENKLRNNGRVLLRASGTEPVVRVMVEGRDDQLVTSIANDLAKLIQSIMN